MLSPEEVLKPRRSRRIEPDCGLYWHCAPPVLRSVPKLMRVATTFRRPEMKVADILRVKGSTLFTVQPDEPLSRATQTMADKDIGSLVVMSQGALAGMLTFREVIKSIVKNGGEIGSTLVGQAMDSQPLTCTPDTEIDDVRRMMLESHARYMPVVEQKVLMGVISFYDVAKAVVDSQNFENQMLKAYIRDWPSEDEAKPS